MKIDKPLRNQSGQILIIFLLILVVGLAIVLSVASRSITDIRTTTTSDESNRAYFAAEAGIEEALKKLQEDNSPIDKTLDFTGVNETKAEVVAKEVSVGSNIFEFPEEAARDDVKQLVLLDDFNQLGGTAYGAYRLNVYWGSNPKTGSQDPAILITVLYHNGTNFGVRKFAFDKDTTRNNNFCKNNINNNPTVNTTEGNNRNFLYHVNLDIRGGVHSGGDCEMDGIGPTNKAVLARFRLLYNEDTSPYPIAVGPQTGAGSDNLPPQGSIVESTGSTVSGVTRKLRVTQLYPALPSIFDYVLFSGSDLVK